MHKPLVITCTYVCKTVGEQIQRDTESSRDVFLNVDVLQCILAVVMELLGGTTGKLSPDERMKDQTNHQYLFLMNVAVKLAWMRVLLTHCAVCARS